MRAFVRTKKKKKDSKVRKSDGGNKRENAGEAERQDVRNRGVENDL